MRLPPRRAALYAVGWTLDLVVGLAGYVVTRVLGLVTFLVVAAVITLGPWAALYAGAYLLLQL